MISDNSLHQLLGAHLVVMCAEDGTTTANANEVRGKWTQTQVFNVVEVPSSESNPCDKSTTSAGAVCSAHSSLMFDSSDSDIVPLSVVHCQVLLLVSIVVHVVL